MKHEPVQETIYSLSNKAPQPDDRRSDERHLTLFRVGTVIVDDRRELCLIKNISAGGMLIRAYCKLAEGTRLLVELKCGEQIHGTVSWTRDGCAGVSFDEPIDVVDILTGSMDGTKPRMPRVEIRCIASVRQGARVYGILARDISQGGVKLESQRELAIGSDVVVTLPGMKPLQGTIRWQHDGSYGVNFHRLLSLSELVAWLQDQRDSLRAAS